MRAAAASNSPDVLSAGRLSPSSSLRGAAAAGASPLLDVATDAAPDGAAEERGVRPATWVGLGLGLGLG